MDDLNSTEEQQFVPEEVEAIILPIIDSVLKNQEYDQKQVPQWIDDICANSMEELVKLQKPYKYAISVVLQQKNGAGLHSSYSSLSDHLNDGLVSCRWPSEKAKDGSKSIACIVSVFGFLL